MSLRGKYRKLNIYSYTDGSETDFSAKAGYSLSSTFKGLIQAPSNSKTFNNAKDTSTISGVLFCSNKQTFGQKDLIENNGVFFRISGFPAQADGVSGLEPKAGQHAEYNLEWVQEGVPSD